MSQVTVARGATPRPSAPAPFPVVVPVVVPDPAPASSPAPTPPVSAGRCATVRGARAAGRTAARGLATAAVVSAVLATVSAAPAAASALHSAPAALATPVASVEHPVSARGEDRLTVTVSGAGRGVDGTYEVMCRPGRGSHPDPEGACAAVERNTSRGRDAFAPPRQDTLCTMQYGGPATARVTGTWAGRPVDATYDRRDGCAIDRWDALVPLLPAAGPAAGPAARPSAGSASGSATSPATAPSAGSATALPAGSATPW
ncbi:SSI family serine proteinase inhibitor [Streptomyces sp. bgisy022]|uniref:SSI family serine proteinase inhibitor n=1 Tax=Streptomyces sp. bgisy022 TaxID=3413769 RepID=UPI003D704376